MYVPQNTNKMSDSHRLLKVIGCVFTQSHNICCKNEGKGRGQEQYY